MLPCHFILCLLVHSQDSRFLVYYEEMCLAQQIHGGLVHTREPIMSSKILGFIKDQKAEHALSLWKKMEHSSQLHIDKQTYVGLLKACGKLRDIESGLQIHAAIARIRLDQIDLFVGNTLVDMYAKCGSLDKAQQVFSSLPSRDVVAWTVLIAGYTEHGQCVEAVNCFERMLQDQVAPNSVTYICSLKACSRIDAIGKGQEIHAEIQRRGLVDGKLAVGNTLVSMYVKFGFLEQAREVFDSLTSHNVVSWTSLIAGYSEQGHEELAIKCIESMQLEGICPDSFTFACGLKACSTLGAVWEGENLHAEVERMGLARSDLFIGNTLVDMYVKWGMATRAQEVFDKLPIQEVVSWTALIAGYAENTVGEEALRLFERMQMEAAFPNVATYICTLKACGSIMASDKGREIHAKLEGLDAIKGDLVAANSLVDMYAKCGLLSKAQEVFDKVHNGDVVLWTTLITGYVGHGDAEKALDCFERMHQKGLAADIVSFVSSLKACGILGLTEKGSRIHAEAEKKGYVMEEIAVSNVLVDMYSKCGKVDEAESVFDRISILNVVSWNALITGYVENGFDNEALKCFEQMQCEGVSPDSLTCVCSLRACSNMQWLSKGRWLHIQIEKRGLLEGEDTVGNTLVDMYAKCGSMAEAHQIFGSLRSRDIVAWNSLIGGYAEHGYSQEALKLVELMQRCGIFPNTITYLYSLKACTNLGAIDKGQELHREIEEYGLLERDSSLGSALVDMYAKCDLFTKAIDVLDKIQTKDVVPWTAMISGYIDQGYTEEAIGCFEQMQLQGIHPNAATFVSILKACCCVEELERGGGIHAEIERRGLLDRNLVIGNALIDMYAKCGFPARAEEVFDRIPVRNVVTWTSLMSGYIEHGQEDKALKCFEQMQLEGISPDSLTFACGLRACASIGDTLKAQEIHADFEKKGLSFGDFVVNNVLLEMYIKLGSSALAEHVFDKLPTQDVDSWNVLLAGYVENGHVEKALKCFERMQYEGVSPNASSLVSSLKACGSVGALQMGYELHTIVNNDGLFSSDFIGNTLLNMYAKCGEMSKAQEVFDNLMVQNVVSWTALIARYVEHNYGEEALDCFEQMQMSGIIPDCITYICILKACGTVGAIDKGRVIHIEVEKNGLPEANPILGNTLVYMYAICGALKEAESVLEKLPLRDVVSWNALIAGYAEIGECGSVFSCFDRMLLDKVKPDSVSFLVVLNVCNRANSFDECQKFFMLMGAHGVVPTLDHITCVIDLCCRAGHLHTAIQLIKEHPFHSNIVAWRTLLNLCRRLGNVSLGRHIFEHALVLNSEDLTVSNETSDTYTFTDVKMHWEYEDRDHGMFVPLMT